MKALGMIETRGLIPAIESADIMLKTSEVELIEKIYVGAGLVTITIVGDVGAVKTAVESAVEAIKKFGENILISNHVIPRPDLELQSVIKLEKEKVVEKEIEIQEIIVEEIEKDNNFEKLKIELEKQKISYLRQKAKEYNNFGLSGKSISKLDKNRLIEKIMECYKNMEVIDDGVSR